MKVSKTGYKKTSEVKNEKSLVVPSNKITMKEDNGEPLKKGRILGIDNLGNMTIMEPGLDYSFPGSYVYEIPMANVKNGGYILPGRFKNPEGNWLSKYEEGGPKRPGDITRVTSPASHFSIGFTSNPNIIYFHDTASDTWTRFNEEQTANFKKTNPVYFTAPAPAAKPAAKPVAKPAAKPVAKPAPKPTPAPTTAPAPVAKKAPAPKPAPVPGPSASRRYSDPLMNMDLTEYPVQESTRVANVPFIAQQQEAQQVTKQAEQAKVPTAKVLEQKAKQAQQKKADAPVSSDEENDLDIAQAIDETFNTVSNFITEEIYLPLEETTMSGLDATLGVAQETAKYIGDTYDEMTGNENKDSFFSNLAPQIQYYREKHFGTDAPTESELQVFEDPTVTETKPAEEKQNVLTFDPKKVDLLSIDSDIDYGKGNSQFWGFRRTATNEDGFTYVPTPRKEKFGNGKGTANVQGMAHFLIESDLTDGYKSQATTDAIERSIKDNQYIPAYKKDYNTGQVHLYYVKGKEPLKEGYNYAANLRQLKLSDIDWNKSRRPAGYGRGVSNILTKDGKDTFIIFKDADVDKNGIHRKMGRNNGNSLVFIIEKDGKRYIRDFAGTVTQIKNESKKIKDEFGVNQDDITLGFYDQGSYNAKPKAKDGFLPYSSYNSFHNSGRTGAGLAMPMYAYGGQVSTGLPTKAYGGDISIPDLSRPRWLYKAQFGLNYTPEPTREDSLELLNNSNMVLNYYNSKNYDNYSTKYLTNDGIKERNFAFIDEAHKKFGPNKTRTTPTGSRTVPLNEYYKPVDKNKFYQRETSYGILDTTAPMQLYDRRILPTTDYTYKNIKKGDLLFGDAVQIYGYDPLSITPWDMLTEDQKKLRVERFGRDGVPEDYNPDKTAPSIKTPTQESVDANQVNMPQHEWWTGRPVLEVLNEDVIPEDRSRQKPIVVNKPPDFKHGGWLKKYQDTGEVKTTFKDWGTGVPKPTPPIRNPLSEADLRKGYTWSPEFGVMAPQVEITAERPYDLVNVPGGHGSMVTAKRYKNNNLSYSPETIGAMNASNEIARSNNIDPITLGFAAAASLPTAGRLLGKEILGSGVSANNILNPLFIGQGIYNTINPESDFRQAITKYNQGEGDWQSVAGESALNALNFLGARSAPSDLGALGKFAKSKVAKTKTPLQLPASSSSANVVEQLRNELATEGIVSSQKTLNFPWKDIIQKGVEPWGYEIKSKLGNIKSLLIDSKNPRYIAPDKLHEEYANYLNNARKYFPNDRLLTYDQWTASLPIESSFPTKRMVIEDRFKHRLLGSRIDPTVGNRAATWDMYLGKPQTTRPIYDISNLTTSASKPIYTIKQDYIDIPAVEKKMKSILPNFQYLETKPDGSVTLLDRDLDMFGTMGGFNWNIKKLPNGNYQAYANDVWDLHPFGGTGYKLIDKTLGNIEVGKALGIGKPLDVRVGFEIDGATGKVIRTFEKGGSANWLNKYQGDTRGSQFNKYDIMSGVYDDMRQAAAPVSTYVQMPTPTEKEIEATIAEDKRLRKVMKETGTKSPAEARAMEQGISNLISKQASSTIGADQVKEKSVGDYATQAWDVATNPATALGYKIRGEEIPWGFAKGERNILDTPLSLINPATYVNAAGRLADAAITPETYTQVIPQTIGATAMTLLGNRNSSDVLPTTWDESAWKMLGLGLDAGILMANPFKIPRKYAIAYRNPFGDMSILGEAEYIAANNPKLLGSLETPYGIWGLVKANPVTETGLARFTQPVGGAGRSSVGAAASMLDGLSQSSQPLLQGSSSAAALPAGKAIKQLPGSSNAPVKTSSVNDILNDLDTDNYYYLTHQTDVIGSDAIINNGFNIGSGFNGTTLWGNKESIARQIADIDAGAGHRGSSDMVILRFPKSMFKRPPRQIDDISDAVVEQNIARIEASGEVNANALIAPKEYIWRTYSNPNKAENVNRVVTPEFTETPQAPKWTQQELPGLHLKSTMDNGPISKIIEPKTGLINVEQALAIIAKESGGADKVSLIRPALGLDIPKKMDYNEFRQIVQNQLIPLERKLVNYRSNYGINRLGYSSDSDQQRVLDYVHILIENQTKLQFATSPEDISHIQEQIRLAEKGIKKYGANLPLENQTLLLSNKNQFGKGSGAHSNPRETLGHIHFLTDVDTPDVLTVTQLQSDAFQGPYRVMRNSFEEALIDVQKQEEHVNRLRDLYANAKPRWDSELYPGANKFRWYELEDGQIVSGTEIEDIDFLHQLADAARRDLKNFGQKSLLDKNHQERFLQELVAYAGERGDINKLRLPTSETAAKVQGYKPAATSDEVITRYNDLKGTTEFDEIFGNITSEQQRLLDQILSGKFKGDIYSPEHNTILKKYSEYPKTIKKLFGIDTKIVTDAKGNTWYEFDIPKAFKEGKGQIKAFRDGGSIKKLKKYQGDKQGSQVPANLPWINQQGQFTQVPPPRPEPVTIEGKVNKFLGEPMHRAQDLAMSVVGPGEDPVDNLRHSAASMYLTDQFGSSLGAAGIANALGFLHEYRSLPNAIKRDGIYNSLVSTAEDLFNNAVGAAVGMLPISVGSKESLLIGLTSNNMLPDGVSMSQGNMYLKKKNGGIKSSGEGYYDYLKDKGSNAYSGIFAKGGAYSKKTSWLNKYK